MQPSETGRFGDGWGALSGETTVSFPSRPRNRAIGTSGRNHGDRGPRHQDVVSMGFQAARVATAEVRHAVEVPKSEPRVPPISRRVQLAAAPENPELFSLTESG